MQNNSNRRDEEIFGVKVRAGRKRTYFFDVKPTRQGDYYICITESKRRQDDSGYDRHKIYVYKEDFNKFLAGLEDSINYVKTELLPDFDFDMFTRDDEDGYGSEGERTVTNNSSTTDAMSIYDTPTDNTSVDVEIDESSEEGTDDIGTGETW